MAARFWVGGTGNWDASTTTHWAATSNGAGGQTVPTASDTVTFDANSGGGTVTATATMACSSFTGGAFTGTFNTNGQTMNCTNAFSYSGTATRTLTLGGSTINCGTWTLTTTTNLTFNVNTSTIVMKGTTFSGGGLTYNVVNLTGASSSINQANTFGTLTRTPTTPTKTNTLSLLANQTITGTFTVSNGATVTNRVLVQSDSPGTTRTITAAVIAISNADFQDITGAGAASWDMSAASGGSGDCGGNTMQALGTAAFTTAATQTANGTTSFSWSTAARWTSRVPLPQDDVVINNAFGTSQTVTADMPRLGKSIDWTGATFTTALTFTAAISVTSYGSLILVSGMTVGGTQGTTLAGRGSYTLTTNGVSFGRDIVINAPSGTYTLGSNFANTTQTFTLSNGTLSAGASNYTFSIRQITVNSGTTLTLGSGTHELKGTGTVFTGTGTISASTGTIKITDTSNVAVYFNGLGKTYNNIWFARGASTVENIIKGSNTFADFKDTGTVAHAIRFTAGTTQTVDTFTVSGNGAGNEITITSDNGFGTLSTSTHALVKSGGGTISCDYLNIQHSVATPASTWYAGVNSTNNQATATAGSGWIFTAPVVGNTTGNMFLAM